MYYMAITLEMISSTEMMSCTAAVIQLKEKWVTRESVTDV